MKRAKVKYELVLFIVGSRRGETAFFFFSSRRRHTRCSRDWSSDVCSSDLAQRNSDPGTGSVRRTGERPVTELDDGASTRRYAARAQPYDSARSNRVRRLPRKIGRASCRERV